MAFKLKTGKTVNKILAGVGIATVGTILLNYLAPQVSGTMTGTIVEGAAAYGVGGVESVAGVALAKFAGGSPLGRGSRALDNIQTESL